MSDMKIGNHGLTYPKGFQVAAVHVGLDEKKDMGLVFSEVPAVCAIVTTSNAVKAAPVLWDLEVTKEDPTIQAIIVNTGIANAATGEEGKKNTKKTAELTAKELDIPKDYVIVSSTGVIGVQLDMKKISKGVKKLARRLGSSKSDAKDFAKAILTTDTMTKIAGTEIEIDGKPVRIGGTVKGSGMIHPNMATMLSYVTTDCKIDPEVLQQMLVEITDDTYNMISVDGDMSTNDTALVLANGLAENKTITSLDSEDGKRFYKALLAVEKRLSEEVIRDGEGATKLFRVKLTGAKNKEEAKRLARAVVSSNLVKTAIAGEDANWGRILSSMGSTGIPLEEDKLSITISSEAGKEELYDGKPLEFSEKKAKEILEEPEIQIRIKLSEGDGEAEALGCDMTHEYITINSEYRS